MGTDLAPDRYQKDKLDCLKEREFDEESFFNIGNIADGFCLSGIFSNPGNFRSGKKYGRRTGEAGSYGVLAPRLRILRTGRS